MGEYMKRKISYLIASFVLLVIIFQYKRTRNLTVIAQQNRIALNDSVKYYKNKLGTVTATINTLQITKSELSKQIKQKDKAIDKLVRNFKSVKNITQFKSEIMYDSIVFVFDKPLLLFAESETQTKSLIRNGFQNTKWYDIGYKLTNDSLIIKPLKINTETTIITGYKKKWFLGKQTLVTDITNTNPHIRIDNINATDIIVPSPWYKKWYVWLATGFVVGIITAN